MKNRAIFILAILFFPILGKAQGPLEFNYQGKIANNDGSPRSGNHSIRFRIYDNAGGTGGALYDQTAAAVGVTNGVFNVMVGRDTGALPVSIFRQNSDLWMRISVNGTDLNPLQKLAASPFAISVASGAVGTAELATGSIMDEDISSSANINPSKINGGSFESDATYLFPGTGAVGISTDTVGAYKLNVQGNVNIAGTLFQNGSPAVFSNWTVSGDDIVRPSSVTINSVNAPAYPLDVYGNINVRGGSLFIDGTQAVFSKWSDAASPTTAVFRRNQVAVGTAVPSGAGLPDLNTYQFHVFDNNATSTIGITQGLNTGELKIQHVASPPAPNTGGFYTYAVYAP